MINVDEHFEGNLKEAKRKDKKNPIIHHPPREGLQEPALCLRGLGASPLPREGTVPRGDP